MELTRHLEKDEQRNEEGVVGIEVEVCSLDVFSG